MIRPTVTISDPSKKAWDNLFKELRVKEAYTAVGVHSGAGKYPGKNSPTVAEVAFWNEFGTETQPERSFIRSTVDEALPWLHAFTAQTFSKVLEIGARGGSARTALLEALKIMGTRIRFQVQNKIKSNVPPPNAPATIAEKERENPQNANRTLMNSELMLRSIQNKEVLR